MNLRELSDILGYDVKNTDKDIENRKRGKTYEKKQDKKYKKEQKEKNERY